MTDMCDNIEKTANRSLNVTGEYDNYGFILEKIWENKCGDLHDVTVSHDFLDYVATANKYWDNGCDHLVLADEDAVVWYLKTFCPDVFCEEFMTTFFDVEDEIPDYDYRDWKANPKFLLFASYINSRGGVDEWNWHNVFNEVMMENDDKILFSNCDWLTTELKRRPYMDWCSFEE
jgi:hypothetical protein